MFHRCCVVNCASRRKDVNLYRFPKTEIGLQKWLECINCEGLRNTKLEDLRKHHVCQKHFEQKVIASTPVRPRLRVGAYPTLFSASEISNGTPETVYTDHSENAVSEQSYPKKKAHEDHTYAIWKPTKKHTMTETEIAAHASDSPNYVDHTMTSFHVMPSTLGCGNEASVNPIIKEIAAHASDSPIYEDHTMTSSDDDQPSTSGCGNEASENPIIKEIAAPASDSPNYEDHDLTSSDEDQPSNSGCENEASVNPIIKDSVIPSTRKSQVRGRRVVLNKKILSPNSARLYREYAKCRKQLEFSRRARKALKFSKEKSFEKLTKNMNPLGKKFMWMQVKQCFKKPKGRRFSTEEKLIALSIQKQSPKCYRFLHNMFILPSEHTLNKMVSELNIEPEIYAQAFDAVKPEVNALDENEKFCSPLFDENVSDSASTYDRNNLISQPIFDIKILDRQTD